MMGHCCAVQCTTLLVSARHVLACTLGYDHCILHAQFTVFPHFLSVPQVCNLHHNAR